MNEGTSADRVADQLRERILQGRLAPGVHLPQDKIAQEFGVSRIPVRDGLRSLAAEGLVKNSSSGGLIVAGTSIAELQELYDMMIALEPALARAAVPNIGRAEVIRMRRLLESMQAAHEPHAWLAISAEFHAQLYRRANRPRILQSVEQLHKLADRYLYLHFDVIGDDGRLDQEHAAILEAVSSNDADLAATQIRRRLVTSHDNILTSLLEQSADTAP